MIVGGAAEAPAEMKIGLLLPKTGIYSSDMYKKVCELAVSDMHAKNILKNTTIRCHLN